MKNRGGRKSWAAAWLSSPFGDASGEKIRVMRLARGARWLINSGAAALALLFGWLKLQGVDFAPIAKELPADVIFKLSLALYYACWVAGVQSDTSDQELVYVTAPDEGKTPFGAVTSAALIGVVFGVLCYVDSYSQFTIFLGVFFVINIISWQYLIKWLLPPIVEKSKEYYHWMGNYAGLEQLSLVYDNYLSGNWQWARFAAGGIVIMIMALMAFSDANVIAAEQLSGFSADLLISLSILLFVLVMETWIWIMRIRLKSGLRLLDDVAKGYQFIPVTTRSGKAEIAKG
jgi:hypothetical protein